MSATLTVVPGQHGHMLHRAVRVTRRLLRVPSAAAEIISILAQSLARCAHEPVQVDGQVRCSRCFRRAVIGPTSTRWVP